MTALVDQADNAVALFDQNAMVELRGAGDLTSVVNSGVVRVFDSGRTSLPHPALGASGGGTIPTDPEDPKGKTTLRPQFELWLALPVRSALESAPWFYPGQRVYVRVTLSQRRPLINQWIHTFRQLFRDRMTL